MLNEELQFLNGSGMTVTLEQHRRDLHAVPNPPPARWTCRRCRLPYHPHPLRDAGFCSWDCRRRPPATPPVDRAWMEHAACRGLDPELFFPGPGAAVDGIKAICGACEVVDDCRAYAVADSTVRGFWGGLAERDRTRLRQQQRAAVS